jgi:eukaryotic-like serine/threonine-protein kinase
MQFWNELEGRTIDDVYPLRRLVRSEGRRAWFETEASHGVPATISLTEAVTDADEVTARLQAAQAIQHPNLVSITKIGQVRLDNTIVVYAVMEHIEQSLSDVLQMQALSADEGREVAEALVGALSAIHQKGMSHGHVEAASVLATEETVKLRSDCLQTNASGQADDVAAIGATIFHAFTQRKALSATDAQINRIPAPFAEIVRNSFGRRWNLAQIGNALKPGQTFAPPPPTPPVPAPSVPVASAPVSTPAPVPAQAPLLFDPPPAAVPVAAAAVEPVAAIPEPRVPAKPVERPVAAPRPPAPEPPPQPAPPRPRRTFDEEPEPQRRPITLYAGIAVVLLAVLAWLFWPKAAVAPTQPPKQAAAPQPAPEAPVPATPAKPLPPSAKTSAAKKVKPEAAAPAASGGEHSVWRVVIYTYRGQTKAQDAVSQISGKHSDLKISVFNPAGSRKYLVVVGGPMDHEHATQLLDKAKREGLPQDMYVRNFKE